LVNAGQHCWKACWPCGAVPQRQPMPSGLSFGLIHPRPPPFTSVRGPPVRAGHGRRRTVVNGGAQYSKACEGATLPWVQIPPPPLLTRHDAHPPGWRCDGGRCVCLSFWPHSAAADAVPRTISTAVAPSQAPKRLRTRPVPKRREARTAAEDREVARCGIRALRRILMVAGPQRPGAIEEHKCIRA
jgi:hypothetical protein